MSHADTAIRPPYRWAALVSLLIFAVYLLTLAPTTAFWDTSEYIAAAKVLGIPHPPGNPLFTVMAHAFGLLPLAGSYAVRINLFAAVTGALSAGLWFLIADRWLRTIVPLRWARLLAAAAGILVAAFAWSVWNQATVNEKVYTVSLLSMSLVTWLAVHWGDDVPGPHRDRWLVLIVYIMTLSSTNHLMGFLALPAVGIYVLWTDWREATKPWVVMVAYAMLLAVTGQWATPFTTPSGALGFNPDITAWGSLVWLAPLVLGYAAWRAPGDFKRSMLWVGLLAVVVGISLNYVFLPIRAGQFPPINEGEPTSWQALLDVLNRQQYQKPSLLERQASFTGQLHNYLIYFQWQFSRDWGQAGRTATTFLFTVLGLGGLVALMRRDRRAGLAAAAMLLTLTIALVYYLNFRYGFSMYPDRPGLPREVRERDYFFIGSFAYFGVLVALGIGAAMRALADYLGQGRGESLSPRARWGWASALCLVGLIPLFGNRITASRANESMARDVAHDLLESVEPYGILITAGDNDTFPLWYAQEVEGIRPDVTLANLSLMNTKWHLKQLRRRETPTFDPDNASEIWRGRDWPKPTNVVLGFSEEGIDSLPEVVPINQGTVIDFDSVSVQLGNQYLERSDIATLTLIRDNLTQRPIYFSWSAAGYPDQTLGLTGYLVTQGLVRRLNPTPLEPTDSIPFNTTLGFVDIPQTRRLLWGVYHWQSASRRRPRGWIDPPSGSILQLYSIVYQGLGPTLREAGDTAGAALADSVGRAVQWNLQQVQ